MVGKALPAGWKPTALGAVANFINGDRSENYPTQADRAQSGVPFINTGHIEPTGRLTTTGMEYITRESFNRLRSGMVRQGDIVYCLRGSTIGKTARNHFAEGAIASSLVIVRAKEHCCQEYLYFCLTSPLGQKLVTQHDNGSAQPNLSVRVLSNYVVSLPPLPEQRAIAHILSTLDDKIELNRRMNETLETIASAIFTRMFAKAESGSGDIPFSEIAEFSREAINPGEYSTEIFEHYSIPAFDERRLPARATGAQIKSNKFILHGDSVLLSKLNPRIPRIWLPSISGDLRSICSTEFLVLCPKPGYSREFIFELCNSSGFQEIFTMMVTGTSGSHQRVKPEYLEKMTVVRPALKSVEKFTQLVGPLLERVGHNLQESCTLALLRDALLPKLISGEIRIKQAEKIVEAHA